jgi:hypothetical protein
MYLIKYLIEFTLLINESAMIISKKSIMFNNISIKILKMNLLLNHHKFFSQKVI